MVYVETARFDETSVARPDIGATHPLLKSSIGLAILANMDPRRRQPLENRLRIADQAAWQTAMPRVESCRKDLTRLGYCATESAVHLGYLTIARSHARAGIRRAAGVQLRHARITGA